MDVLNNCWLVVDFKDFCCKVLECFDILILVLVILFIFGLFFIFILVFVIIIIVEFKIKGMIGLESCLLLGCVFLGCYMLLFLVEG